jgi:acetylornithine aminotransferase
MIGVELPKACGDLVNIARDEYHTIINVTAGSVVRLLPTLNITKDQADQLIERLVKMIKATWLVIKKSGSKNCFLHISGTRLLK